MQPTPVKDDSFAAGKPRLWSNKQVAPDGKRIAALMPVETPDEQKPETHVNLLLNFFDELRRRVPAGGKN